MTQDAQVLPNKRQVDGDECIILLGITAGLILTQIHRPRLVIARHVAPRDAVNKLST